MLTMDVRADQRQHQAMSPRLQQAVRLLTLSSLDYVQEVHHVLGSNPFLESEDPDDVVVAAHDDEPTEVDRYGDSGAALDDACAPYAAEPERTADDTAGTLGDHEPWMADASQMGQRQRGGELPDGDRFDRLPFEASLASHLHAQLGQQALPARARALAKVIVDSLDDDGYLRTPLRELRSVGDVKPVPTVVELERALTIVHGLDPLGVGARDVAECLRLQLPAIPCEDTRTLALRIVDEHLDKLASRDVNGLARATGRSPADVERVCDRIRRLDPRPGWRHGASRTQYIVPDVIVRKQRGIWTVQLNSAVVPRVKLNSRVADLFQRCRRDQNPALADHLQQARWTLRNVEQRYSTILDVAQAIVRRQKQFLDHGPMAMKPLALRDIGDEIGAHESTVSRVTNNKYMATPAGVFELKYFFSRAMPTRSGGACSGTAIRGLIHDMIQVESPTDPLSDAEIARRLMRQGLTVARRTVTKYRQTLRIEAVERRRRHD